MKKIILGTFTSVPQAEMLIKHLQDKLQVPEDDISYVYRNPEGRVEEVEGADIGETDGGTPAEGATTGAVVGGSVGALAGLAAVVGVIPVVGPIFAAGPLVAALGLGAGAVGTTAAGALTGAIAGGVIGALVNLGTPESAARLYEERIMAGEVLVVVYSNKNESDIKGALAAHGASAVEVYTPAL